MDTYTSHTHMYSYKGEQEKFVEMHPWLVVHITLYLGTGSVDLHRNLEKMERDNCP